MFNALHRRRVRRAFQQLKRHNTQRVHVRAAVVGFMLCNFRRAIEERANPPSHRRRRVVVRGAFVVLIHQRELARDLLVAVADRRREAEVA